MRTIFLILLGLLIIILLAGTAHCDEFQILRRCYPQKWQELFAEHGLKLDLDDSNPTPDSWGFIENRGSSFSIFTYEPTKMKDRDLILKLSRQEAQWQKEQREKYGENNSQQSNNEDQEKN